MPNGPSTMSILNLVGFFTLLCVVFLAGLALSRSIYALRSGERRVWWAAVAAAGVVLVAVPLLGWAVLLAVLLIERESPKNPSEARSFITFPDPDDPALLAPRQRTLGMVPPLPRAHDLDEREADVMQPAA